VVEVGFVVSYQISQKYSILGFFTARLHCFFTYGCMAYGCSTAEKVYWVTQIRTTRRLCTMRRTLAT